MSGWAKWFEPVRGEQGEITQPGEWCATLESPLAPGIAKDVDDEETFDDTGWIVVISRDVPDNMLCRLFD